MSNLLYHVVELSQVQEAQRNRQVWQYIVISSYNEQLNPRQYGISSIILLRCIRTHGQPISAKRDILDFDPSYVHFPSWLLCVFWPSYKECRRNSYHSIRTLVGKYFYRVRLDPTIKRTIDWLIQPDFSDRDIFPSSNLIDTYWYLKVKKNAGPPNDNLQGGDFLVGVLDRRVGDVNGFLGTIEIGRQMAQSRALKFNWVFNCNW